MKLYPRLAVGGIRKNRSLYLPYILTCVGMVMIFFILSALSFCPLLDSIYGGSTVRLILNLGSFIVGFFSLIFLFYTNSFLINRRNKEFGLYNILGMDRGKIRRIVLWESFFAGLFSIVIGIAL
ncbi:MAG: ABC transporter permease, partial [Oscillospiraceae bacterium]|nr:ABC transporter permease [Oscillospiraceae bacterium]